MKDFIFSKEFANYRKKQVEAVVGVIHDELLNGDPAVIKGQLKLARRIFRIPGEMVSDKALMVNLKQLINADFTRVYVELSRKGMVEDE